jgi:cyclic pyranopterin phosphate synthase
VTVRFIEFMPLDADGGWSAAEVVPGREIVDAIAAVHPLEPVRREHEPAARWRYVDGRGEIGVIDSVTEPFCAACDRIRLTADGRLRTCLFSLNETDLRTPLRAGATDDDLEQIVRDAVWRKELKHRVNEPGFVQPERTMSAIGG